MNLGVLCQEALEYLQEYREYPHKARGVETRPPTRLHNIIGNKTPAVAQVNRTPFTPEELYGEASKASTEHDWMRTFTHERPSKNDSRAASILWLHTGNCLAFIIIDWYWGLFGETGKERTLLVVFIFVPPVTPPLAVVLSLLLLLLGEQIACSLAAGALFTNFSPCL